MKLECIKDKLRDAVLKTDRVTGKNLTLPVLGSILIIAEGKSIKLRATNLDLGIEFEIPAKIEKNGAVAVPGSVIGNFLNNIPDKNIKLESKDGNLIIKGDNSSILIKCHNYEDFPTIPLITDSSNFSIPLSKFTEGIKSVAYSASLSDIKPEISSVYIYPDDQYLIFVATDSFRLAEKKINIKNNKDFQGVILPLRNSLEIIKIFDGATEDAKIIFNKNQIAIISDGIYLTSRIIDGIFPDYKQIVPKTFKTEAVALKQDVINSLKISNIFSDKFNQINLAIDPAKKVFNILSKNPDIGESEIGVDASLSGDDVEISFNHKYITDCFQSINKDSVSFSLNGKDKPMVINGIGDNSFTYLVMPLNR